MNFKIGDFVCVMDDDISGRISKIKGADIEIETTDGFDLVFKSKDLVKISDNLLKTSSFKFSSIDQILSEKASNKLKKSQTSKKKFKKPPSMEVDLHIHQLVKSTKNMSNYDMLTLQLDTAKRRLEFAISKRIQRVIFIHGVGAGVLKLELEYLFGRYDNIKFYPGSYQKYGQGATEVYIFQKQSL